MHSQTVVFTSAAGDGYYFLHLPKEIILKQQIKQNWIVIGVIPDERGSNFQQFWSRAFLARIHVPTDSRVSTLPRAAKAVAFVLSHIFLLILLVANENRYLSSLDRKEGF